MCVHCRHAGGIACVSPQVRTNTTTKQGDDQYTTAHAVAVLVGDAGIIKRVLQQGSESNYAVISLLHPPYPPKKEQKSENNPQDTSKHRITRCDICQSEQYQHLRSPSANQTYNVRRHTLVYNSIQSRDRMRTQTPTHKPIYTRQQGYARAGASGLYRMGQCGRRRGQQSA